VFLEYRDIITTNYKKRAQDENPDERSVPGDPGEWIIDGGVQQAVVAGAVVQIVGPLLGLAMPKHEEHLHDERTLHPQKCHCYESTDLQRRCDLSDAALQAGCAVHPGCHVVEDEGLRADGDTVPLLGDPGRRQLRGSAERGGLSSGHPRDRVGIGRWYRKHFGATSSQMSPESRRN